MVRGVRYLVPGDYLLVKKIFSVWRKVCESYGFEEVDFPVLEDFNLFLEKSGDELIKETYNFKDQGGRWLCLRPELTPQLIKVFLEKEKEFVKPVKWFSVARLFRYEKPQKGRMREFFQLNVDVVDYESVRPVGEVISVGAKILEELGFKDFVIKINSRKVVDELLKRVGANNKRVYQVIDKRNKISEEEFVKELRKTGLKKEGVEFVKQFTTIKTGLVKGLEELEKLSVSVDELRELVDVLKSYGILKYCVLDLSVVRGLAYYDGIVFEVFDEKEEYRAVLGGGEYPVNGFRAVGFGMGDAVISEILVNKGLTSVSKGLDYFVIIFKETLAQGLRVVNKLRSKGFRVSYDYELRSVSKQFKLADKLGAEKVVVVGEKEVEKGVFTVKDLRSGEEKVVRNL